MLPRWGIASTDPPGCQATATTCARLTEGFVVQVGEGVGVALRDESVLHLADDAVGREDAALNVPRLEYDNITLFAEASGLAGNHDYAIAPIQRR